MNNAHDPTDNSPAVQNEFELDPISHLQDPSTQAIQNLSNNNYVGTPITEEKGDNIFRVFSGNPNGLKLCARGGDYSEYMEEMKRMKADVVCLYEINLDTHKPKVKNCLYQTTRYIFDHAKLSFASTPIPSKNPFKPGGTLILSQGNSSGRVVAQDVDPMGRWSYQTFSCKGDKNLTVISAYQVCQQPIRTDGRVRTLTASAQQTSILRQQGRDISPRKAFIQDLKDFILNQRAQKNGVLLLGDFNEELEVTYDGMTKLCSELTLTDLMFQLTGEDEFATFQDGSSRLDYALCDEWVATAALAGCYEPFQFRTKGDHRNMIIDFDSQLLFGNPTYRLATQAQREFTSKDASAVRQYCESKYEYLEQHKFGERIAQLKDNWSPELAEQLDRDFQRAGRQAAKKCKAKPNVAYTIELSKLRRKKNVLLRVLSQARTGIDLSDAIAQQAKHGNDFLIPATLEECQKQCREAQNKIRKMEKDSATHRMNQLKQQQKDRAAAGDKKGAKEIRNLIVAENTRNMYRKLRSCRGFVQSGLSRLEVPKDPHDRQYKQCTEWITIDAPKDIEEKLLERNQHHFGQADQLFPTVPPFSEWVDWGASTHTAELILNGQFTSPDIDELSNDLVRHMSKRAELDSISLTLSKDEYIGKIKSWPESTSTSPSGFHLSHSKALIAKHGLKQDSPQAEAFQALRDQLIDWQLDLLNTALQHGYSYERWKVVVNVMILKEPNNIKIHRLRVIHLYEHDYNLLLANKWRALIISAARAGTINEGQYGAMPGKDAITPTIIEELQYEISRASKRPLVHMDYDATACYDRIIMSLGSLISRGYGQHRQVVLINAKTLQEAKYLLKTKLGVSDGSYRHCEAFPIYGSGQGAGNSPGIWCVISSTLFHLYEEKAHGASFSSPDGSVKVKVYMIGFVDDTSGSINDFFQPTPQSPEHYASLATHDAQRWNDILKLSGGALEDTKCSYHFMYYDFTMSGLPVLRGGTFDPKICIKFNSHPTATPLTHLSAYSARKTLGVQKAPAAVEKKSFDVISKKNSTHAKTIARSPFNRTDSWSYYHAIYLPSLTYPFPSGNIPNSQCDQWQVEIKKALLPKYGFNRNMPNAVVYGHSDYGGLEFRTLSVEKGLAQLQSLITCLRADGIPNKLAMIAISWAQCLAGVSFPIFEDVHKPLPHLAPMTWLPAIRDFLASIYGSLELASTYVPPVQRVNDVFLMDKALEMDFTDTEIKLINACRLYLGVTFLSCISSAAGTSIRREFIDGTLPLHDKFKGYMPYQDRPNAAAWKLWNKLLAQFVYPNTPMLCTPLGQWLVSGDATHRQWLSYADETYAYLYKQGEYERLSCVSDNIYEFDGTVLTSLPTTAVPADLDLSDDSIYLLYHTSRYVSPRISPPNSFVSFVATLELWEQELLQNVDFDQDVFEFVDVINRSGEILCTSDGSAPKFTGSFGWVCSLTTGRRIARNNGPAYGYRTSSYRAEGYGLLSFMRLIYRAFEYASSPLPGNLKLYTDSESAVKEISTQLQWPYYFPNATLKPDWDVLQAIIRTIRLFPIAPTLQHVVGHQDDTRAYESLSLPAQLNVDADALAGNYQYAPSKDPSKVPRIEGNSVQLHLLAGTINSRYKQVIRKTASASAMRRHICRHNEWSHRTFDLVDWTAHGTAIRKHYHRKHFVTKYVHDWLPVGKLVSRYKGGYEAKCPSCSAELEDRSHFLRCSSRPDWKIELYQELRDYCEKNQTRPALADILREALQMWLNDEPVVISDFGVDYIDLIRNQDAIGWGELFLGRFTRDWSELQDDFLSSLGTLRKKKLSGSSWVVGITSVIWKHVYKNWEDRNSKRHGIDAATREAALLERAKRETAALYDIKDDVLPRDRELFYDSIQEHYEKEPKSTGLRQWLMTWQPVILQSVTEGRRLGTRGMRSITDYFRRVPSNNSNATT